MDFEMADYGDLKTTKRRIKEALLVSMKVGGIREAFEDPRTTELMVNPDGSFWVEKQGDKDPTFVGMIPEATTRSIISNVAGFHELVVNADNSVCEAEFPLDGSRFEGVIPPTAAQASFCLRKKANTIFTLEQYVQSGTMSANQRELITKGIIGKQNILIVGGTGSGKTTLINGIIEKMVHVCPGDRIVIIEDTAEIQCSAKNKVALHASKNVSMSDCLRITLRERPDRIIVGEVRGPEALDLINAWNTGHPGGMATVHANSAPEGLSRLISLCTANPNCPRIGLENNIAQAVNFVVNIARDHGTRKIRSIIRVTGYDPKSQQFLYQNVC